METALTQERLAEMFDQTVREVTERTSGVRLYQGAQPPGEDLCTVHISFKKGLKSSLSLCAERAMLTRMASRALREECITPQDLEDFTKEYFNVLCGQIAAALFRTTKVASRFGIPSFHQGRYEPEGQENSLC